MKPLINDENNDAYIKDMQAYIISLKTMSKKEAQKMARESLIRTGVLDKAGKPQLLVK